MASGIDCIQATLPKGFCQTALRVPPPVNQGAQNLEGVEISGFFSAKTRAQLAVKLLHLGLEGAAQVERGQRCILSWFTRRGTAPKRLQHFADRPFELCDPHAPVSLNRNHGDTEARGKLPHVDRNSP